jgi:hypothetical protein
MIILAYPNAWLNLLASFNYSSYPQSTPTTNGLQSKPGTAPFHLMQEGDQPHGIGRSNGVTKGNARPIHINYINTRLGTYLSNTTPVPL